VTAEFNWWLLIVGLVVGATLVWLVLADSSRRDSEIANEELPMEAAWIAATMREAGDTIEPDVTERVLRLHRLYLASLPPDDVDDEDDRVDREIVPDPRLDDDRLGDDPFNRPAALGGRAGASADADASFDVNDRSEPVANPAWDDAPMSGEPPAEPHRARPRAPRKSAG
jgi:hypothetical protein